MPSGVNLELCVGAKVKAQYTKLIFAQPNAVYFLEQYHIRGKNRIMLGGNKLR